MPILQWPSFVLFRQLIHSFTTSLGNVINALAVGMGVLRTWVSHQKNPTQALQLPSDGLHDHRGRSEAVDAEAAPKNLSLTFC